MDTEHQEEWDCKVLLLLTNLPFPAIIRTPVRTPVSLRLLLFASPRVML